MPRILSAIHAVQSALWGSSSSAAASDGTQLPVAASDPKSARSRTPQPALVPVPVRWGEPLAGVPLVIDGAEDTQARYAAAGEMECGREGKYLLLVPWFAAEGATRALCERLVVPLERVRKLVSPDIAAATAVAASATSVAQSVPTSTARRGTPAVSSAQRPATQKAVSGGRMTPSRERMRAKPAHQSR